MATTYRNYLWFKDDEFGAWQGNGHVVSLIRDATAQGVLDALGAFSRRRTGVGYAGFVKRSMEFELLGLVPPTAQTVQTVGVADIGDGWVLLIQQNSEWLGVDDVLFGPVIEQHEVVSHFSNVNADSRFVWWRDGQRQISFDPLLPTWDLDRARSSPTAGSNVVLDLIPEVGGIAGEESDEPPTEFFHIEGCFALAERLTGIEVTRELLESADFTVALVPTTSDPEDRYEYGLPPRVPLVGDQASWSEVHQLYRSSAEATIHATMVLSTNRSDVEERHEVEFWYSPFDGTRQVDAAGLLSVDGFAGHWHRGPYPPSTWPGKLVAIHRRWQSEVAFRTLIEPTTPGTATTVNGRKAWEFVFPSDFGGKPIAVAFDAHTGIVLRAETDSRTEELSNVALDEPLDAEFFVLPE